MELRTVRYLKSFSNQASALEQLKSDYGIRVKQYDDRIVLNYSQIDSDKNCPLSNECRGLILSYPEFDVLAKGYDRFLNMGENDFYPSNWAEWKLLEKCDGSYIQFYFHKDKWEITTRGVALGESVMAGNTLRCFGKEGMTYREAIIHEFFGHEEDFQNWACDSLGSRYTYMFEFCGESNRIVKKYPNHQLILHGVTDLSTMEFSGIEYGLIGAMIESEFPGKMRRVFEYQADSKEAMDSILSSFDALDEGFVCVNTKYPFNGEPHRIKVKKESYLIVHAMRSDNGVLSVDNAIQLFLSGDHVDYLQNFSEDQPLFNDVENAFKDLIYDINTSSRIIACIGITDQKEYALKVKDLPYSMIMFTIKAKNLSVMDAFESAKDSVKLKLIRYYYDNNEKMGENDGR